VAKEGFWLRVGWFRRLMREPMSEPAPVSSITTSGRVVRAALIIFPFGTIILGIASFGFWWVKRVQVEERSYSYATALRRDMTLTAMERFVGIFHEVLQLPESERLTSVASFAESSMSSDNMGYEPRRDRFFSGSQEVSNVDAEMAGSQRLREVRLILVLYGDQARSKAESQALGGLMSLANAMAGRRAEDTLRFAAVPMGVKDPSGRTALERFAFGMANRGERLMSVTLLGGAGEQVLSDVALAFRTAQTGAIVQNLPETQDLAATLAAMTALKKKFEGESQ
jgi:hypothetical protein